MRLFVLSSLILFLCLSSTAFVFAQTITPTPVTNREISTPASGSSILSSFISGFDWISSGLIFYTPSLLDSTIKLQDGTELTGMSNFRNIFYDIAVPLFVLITSFVAFSHISNDNAVQLQQFFKRLFLIVALFIITPAILSYSIQFINLLNEKIVGTNAYNLSTLVNDFLNGFVQVPIFQQLFGRSIFLPSWDTIMQLIILIISVGFLLIGFIYIVFQAVIRFIALLILSVIFPVVLPFALSEKTENIANTYFRTWFSFLIQQPAFVLGFAIVSAILTSIAQAHNNSIGTLFVYSGSLIFLGGINVFIGRIFGEGWTFMTTNAQSMIGAHTVNKGAIGIARNEKVKRVPVYAGRAASGTTRTIVRGFRKLTSFGNKTDDPQKTQETKSRINILRRELKNSGETPGSHMSGSKKTKSDNKILSTNTKNTISQNDPHTTASAKQDLRGDNRKASVMNQQERSQTPITKSQKIITQRKNTMKPITQKRLVKTGKTEKKKNAVSVPRRKITV